MARCPEARAVATSGAPKRPRTYPTLPDDNVPDKRLIRRAVEQVELAAAFRKGTTFSREMLQDPASC